MYVYSDWTNGGRKMAQQIVKVNHHRQIEIRSIQNSMLFLPYPSCCSLFVIVPKTSLMLSVLKSPIKYSFHCSNRTSISTTIPD